jgi:beta-1,4-mannosyltransferase
MTALDSARGSASALAAQGRALVLARDWAQARHAYTQAFEADPAQWWHAVEAMRACKRMLEGGEAAALIPLVFHPDYTVGNSYQAHLYSAAPQHGVDARGVMALSLDDDDLMCRVLAPRAVFHQHWLHEIYRQQLDDEVAGLRALRRHLSLLRAFKSFKCRVLWTLHNLVDHDAGDVQKRLSQRAVLGMVKVADRILVHDAGAAQALSAQVGQDIAVKCHVLPHPLYDDLLGLQAEWPPELAGIHEPPAALTSAAGAVVTRVVLMVGQLRPYKGGRDLMSALEQLVGHPAASAMRVVLAGQLADDTLPPAVAALQARCPGLVMLLPRRLAEDELAALVARADLVVMPYQRVLTSGTYFLAATFGKPALAPRLGMFASAVADGVDGLLYDGSIDGLAMALERTCALDIDELAAMGQRARDQLGGQSIQAVSERFFREVLS